MPNPDFKKPQQFALNHVWNDALQKWVPQALSSGVGSDVNVTNTSLDVHNYVWDTGTLAWVVQEQGGAGGGDASLAEQQTQTTHLAAIEVATEALNTKVATAKTADYDTGAGTDPVEMVGLALPGAGGAVAGGTSTNPVRTDPTGTTTQPVSAASLPLPTGASTSAKQDTAQTALDAIKTAVEILDNIVAGSEAQVDIVASLPAGDNNIGNVDVVTLPNVVLAAGTNPNEVVGDAAHDAAVAGNPVLVGAEANRARITAVADGDVSRVAIDRYGRLKTVGGADPTVTATQVTASGDTSLIAAPGAGTRLKILRVEASNSHASTAATIGLKSPSLNGGAVFGKRYLPAVGGAAVWQFPFGHLMCGVNEAFSANLGATGQVEVTTYYETVAD